MHDAFSLGRTGGRNAETSSRQPADNRWTFPTDRRMRSHANRLVNSHQIGVVVEHVHALDEFLFGNQWLFHRRQQHREESVFFQSVGLANAHAIDRDVPSRCQISHRCAREPQQLSHTGIYPHSGQARWNGHLPGFSVGLVRSPECCTTIYCIVVHCCPPSADCF